MVEVIKKDSPEPEQVQKDVEKARGKIVKDESPSKSDSDDDNVKVCNAKSEPPAEDSEVSSNSTVRNTNSVIDLGTEKPNLPVDTDKAKTEKKEEREDTAETEEKIASKEKETSPDVSSSSSSEWEISESERKSVEHI